MFYLMLSLYSNIPSLPTPISNSWQQLTYVFPISLVVSFQECYINGNIQYVTL